MLLKKMKKRALLFSLLLSFPSLPPLCPPSPPAVGLHMPFRRVQPLGEPGGTVSTQTGSVAWVLWGRHHQIKPSSRYLATCWREASHIRDATVLLKPKCQCSTPPNPSDTAGRTVQPRGPAEQQIQLESHASGSEGPSTLGSTCRCCQRASTKGPHRPAGPESG